MRVDTNSIVVITYGYSGRALGCLVCDLKGVLPSAGRGLTVVRSGERCRCYGEGVIQKTSSGRI